MYSTVVPPEQVQMVLKAHLKKKILKKSAF